MNQSTFAVPADQRYFEHYLPGSVFEFGEIEVNEADVIEFAERFDPQSLHVDPVAAESGPFGGLIASGWHTAGLMMRLFTDHYLSSVASLASPGVDELRWIRPVRPGDLLRVRVVVLSANRSRSKPDRGMVRSGIEVLNQRGEVVMSVTAMNLFRCAPLANSRSR
jgi:acyl dehydratase